MSLPYIQKIIWLIAVFSHPTNLNSRLSYWSRPFYSCLESIIEIGVGSSYFTSWKRWFLKNLVYIGSLFRVSSIYLSILSFYSSLYSYWALTCEIFHSSSCIFSSIQSWSCSTISHCRPYVSMFFSRSPKFLSFNYRLSSLFCFARVLNLFLT